MGWFSTWVIGLLKTHLLFMVEIGNEDVSELAYPAKYELTNAENLFFTGFKGEGDENEGIGAWFISPEGADDGDGYCSKEKGCSDRSFYSHKPLSSDATVFLLLHGNGKNRGASHRIAAYKTFQKLGFYTLTIDYRGYGDSKTRRSTKELTESTVVEDAMMAIRELRAHLGEEFNLILYGHSMGSGISTHSAVLAQEEGLRLDGIVLDSPFHSFTFGKEKSWIAIALDSMFDMAGLLEEHDILFNSVEWLKKIKVPVRILHADCDPLTPVEGAEQLVKDAHAAGKMDVNLVRFTEEGLGHIGISTTAGFQNQIQDFAKSVAK